MPTPYDTQQPSGDVACEDFLYRIKEPGLRETLAGRPQPVGWIAGADLTSGKPICHVVGRVDTLGRRGTCMDVPPASTQESGQIDTSRTSNVLVGRHASTKSAAYKGTSGHTGRSLTARPQYGKSAPELHLIGLAAVAGSRCCGPGVDEVGSLGYRAHPLRNCRLFQYELQFGTIEMCG